ncbi:hypothetical protein FIBSPDRAFT_874454 [Athelia psychrophila]|uniref:CUE domain-containing protein n=1 Tax=Athelia psychrophila TaxID=1759441 RepID=A0A165XGN0_9AGAM|nr:hypothetical protein FIBSPDRAFT_874454 [Fibularhizoctonia sp. CBS 109695]
MFPDIPADNIRYDLLRTGNIELTSNKILERGFLDAPPAGYYILYPRTAANGAAAYALNTGATTTATKPKQSLISRYELQDRAAAVNAVPILDSEVGGKAVWEDSAEKREASLKERKAKMILAARQRMLAQQTPSAGAEAVKS